MKRVSFMKQSNEHDESLFYCDVEENDVTKKFIAPLKQYSIQNSRQIYILRKALGTNKEYAYNLTDVAIILIPKHPILILNYGSAEMHELEDFLLDFREDLGVLSNKYNYDKILGRARKWPNNLFAIENLEKLDLDDFLKTKIDFQYQRKIDLLISLLIGSINSIDKIGLTEPETLLEKVKQKIILFDGQQSRFIYQTRDQKSILIQGMAGTGKTELLLHKLKDVYSTEKDSIIAFTCHNKVLANDMRSRIPQFFNFMKVEEQIEWDKRLHVFSSWGSASNPNSGLYRFICARYNLEFSTYGENSNFNLLCHTAVNSLNEKEYFEPCFDYIFIDESQDFKDGFFELCKKVTRKTVYIAGDIFQNIYDNSVNTAIAPDFLLNKCYRTDPKTLMFAHAVGMGLYETPQLNWLDDNAWISCGYSIERDSTTNLFALSRKPLRRFEDLDATNTIRLSTSNTESFGSEILKAIDEIKSENPSVAPEDIAVIILGNYQKLCTIADEITYSLHSKYHWDSSKGYITKLKEPGKVYISNVNNVKGLEFPFVICAVPRAITSNILSRNSIYMALTRSFLTSYFIIDEENTDFFNLYTSAIKRITEKGKMELHEPSAQEREDMATKIQITLSTKPRLVSEILDELFNIEYPRLDNETRKLVINIINRGSAKLSEEKIKQRARSLIEEYLGAGMP